MDLISVIVPVYNVENYLIQCLNSIVSQTYSNLEIIIIDDNSSDQSGVIADEFADQFSNIIVIHTANRGAAAARNTGLKQANGKFIMFVDSDDWLEKNAIDCMYQVAISQKADIVQCQYFEEYLSGSKKHDLNYSLKETLSDLEYIKRMLKEWECVLLWNKLIRTELLKGIFMTEGRCIDDEFFTYKYVARSRRIVIIPDYLYHYRIRKSGAMLSLDKRKQRMIDQCDFVTERYSVLVSKYPMLKPMLLMHLCDLMMTVMRKSKDFPSIYCRAKKELIRYGVRALCCFGVTYNMKKNIIKYLLYKKISIENQQKIHSIDYYE
ncbi:putative glycosyltransferase [Lachnospiraceae bacterium TWA4]|nr:putative glycosyltransferase [Lachnospiraceae bacterium TWA4]